MPKIDPGSGEVSWPANEGTIGVVGVAPWATLDFCRAVYSFVPAAKDWQYPRILVDANSKIPSRGRHLQLGEQDFSPAIKATIAELAVQGATVVVVPCNTAHVLYDRWAADAPVPVPNIIELTVARLAQNERRRVAALGSASLAAWGVYARELERRGLASVPVGSLQHRVSALIESVKTQAASSARHHEMLCDLLAGARACGADAAALGCTELSVARAGAGGPLPLPVVDSNEELARASLRLTCTPFRDA